MSTVLFPGSPGAHGPPALFNRHPSQGTWVNYKRQDFQRRLSWGIFPQRGCASLGRESNGEITGGGELPAPALRLAVSPSFRGGPGLDREGVTCQPMRWGRQRGSGRGAEMTPCPKPRLQRGARYLSPDGNEDRTA